MEIVGGIGMFESERLYLRRFKDQDLDFFYAYRNDEECSRYQSWKDNSKEGLKALIDQHKIIDLFTEGTLQIPIVLKENDQMIGHLFFALRDRTFTIGYTLARNYWHHGYAREIVRRVCDQILEDYPDYEIVALIHEDNLRSQKLIEDLHFQYEGKVRSMNAKVYVKTKQS